jgi:hypothetical protein
MSEFSEKKEEFEAKPSLKQLSENLSAYVNKVSDSADEEGKDQTKRSFIFGPFSGFVINCYFEDNALMESYNMFSDKREFTEHSAEDPFVALSLVATIGRSNSSLVLVGDIKTYPEGQIVEVTLENPFILDNMALNVEQITNS